MPNVLASLRMLKRIYGYPDAALAPILGVSRAAVSARLNGQTDLKARELVALAHWFKVPIDLLERGPNDVMGYVVAHDPGLGHPDDRARGA
ncbi:MAG: helix-turn-helix domain-containing protein [Actinomycetota bacterium]|nr:helix-turn-helix domain-containing protein [Actinomycetota bacterium]MDQ3640868.1 helix-turn-helix domain-containing protein [Actinomycetota bacterium]